MIFAVISEKLIDKNSSMYEENAEYYSETFGEYSSELDKLIDAFNALEVTKPIVLADRNPFNYLFEDCGIDCQAAFDGCSAETEASFETIVNLAKKLDDLGLDTIFTIENSDDSLAKAIIDNSSDKKRSIESLNSIQSVTAEMVDSGVTYISIMEENLETLRRVLD